MRNRIYGKARGFVQNRMPIEMATNECSKTFGNTNDEDVMFEIDTSHDGEMIIDLDVIYSFKSRNNWIIRIGMTAEKFISTAVTKTDH